MTSMRTTFLMALAFLALSACTTVKEPAMDQTNRIKQLSIPTPVAAKHEYTAQYHGKTLSDPYHWLRDQGYPEVNDQPILDYLNQENAYFDAFLAPNEVLVNTVFEEFKCRVNEQESSVPWIDNGFEYQWYFKEGQEYRTYSRKNLQTGEETIFLDQAELAKDHDYFSLGGWDISPNNRYLAYSVDTSGDERYELFIKDLQTGEILSDKLTDVQGDASFGADSQSLIYSLLEKDKWLAKNILVHKLGTAQADDTVIYTEQDEAFFIGVGQTSSQAYFLIVASQGETTETYVLPADNLYATPTLLVSREAKFQNNVDHANGYFYILANDTHKNFRLAKVTDNAPVYENWETVIAGSDNVYLQNLQTFKDFMVLHARDQGIEQIVVRDYAGESTEVVFPEPIFSASIGFNSQFEQNFVRLNYESMITPETVFDYSIENKTLTTRKVQEIPSGYDKTQYVTERLMAPARDGVLVPVSIVYKKGFKKDASQPMMLYGYGAYGITITPSFSSMRLSLLDRGFSFAIAHVRGSDMLGYQWYLDGKLDKRTNTFNDFEDVARFLIAEKYVQTGNISISGRSAGGELMGAMAIQAPDLWRSITLGVPFVDVLNTMLDATLPLTPPEWQEWGNPIESAQVYDLLESYSPYDNITAREYPPMLVSGGLNDPRVTYWEPAKWTAKMREMKTDDNLLVMRINMGAGHFANSGRYGRLKDYAEEYTFVLRAHGIEK